MPVRLTASWSGGKKFDRLSREWTKNATDGVNKAAFRVERQIKINAVKGGAFRRAKGRPWVPNTGKHLRRGDGTLVNSWTAKPAQVVGSNVEAHVSSWVPYAAIHEFGGRTGRGGMVLMPQRPYVRPAVTTLKLQIVKDVQDAVMRPAK